MSVFDVYNSCDSIEAKNLFAMQSEDDIFSDIYLCTCVVHVENAYLDEVYQGYGKLRRRELVLEGEVTGAFIEPNDDRIFPCGSKHLRMMVPQPVKIHWYMSADELATIEAKGCTYSDFELPPNLLGNDIEIPMTIQYQGIYESPVVAIEVLDPFEVPTCTLENKYDGFFNTCVESKEVEAQKMDGYAFYTRPDYENMYEPEYASDEMETTIEEEVLLEQTEEEIEDEGNYEAVNKLIAEQTAESEARRARREAHAADTRTIVGMVNAKLAKSAEQYQMDNETNLWDAMSYGDESTETKVVKQKASYDDFKFAAMEYERQKAEEERLRSEEEAKKVDIANDNMLMNAGIDDISGYSGAETDSQLQEKQDEKSGKKSAIAARRQDIAADNIAMNEGRTDIAGHGANEHKPVTPTHSDKSAQDLVKNLFGLNPVTPQQDKDQPSFL